MQGTIIQNQRADLCLDAMREGCTHILFIDSDMTFPQDLVGRLLAHDKEIVGQLRTAQNANGANSAKL